MLEFMSISNTPISKKKWSFQLTIHWQNISQTYLRHFDISQLRLFTILLATSTHAEWILRHHRWKRSQTWNEGLTSAIFNPQQAGKTQITGHIQRVTLSSTTFHCLEYTFDESKVIIFRNLLTDLCSSILIVIHSSNRLFHQGTERSLIDCLVDFMMFRVVENSFIVLQSLGERVGLVMKFFRNPCLMSLRSRNIETQASKTTADWTYLKLYIRLQQAYIHNQTFWIQTEFIKRKILNNLKRSFHVLSPVFFRC